MLTKDPTLVNALDTHGWPPLWHAARAGHLETARLLLERGADVSLDGGEVLHQAAQAPNKHAMVDLLIAHDALDHFTRPRDDEERWFHAAVFAAAEEQVDAMLRDNPELANRPDGRGTAMLYHAAAHDDCGLMRLLRAHGADLNARDHRGRTLLYAAAAHGNPEAVRLLLEWGADPGEALADGHPVRAWVAPYARNNPAVQECLELIDDAAEG
jgi:ankyrin repeat protein